MSITLYEKSYGKLHGEVRQEKGCKGYNALITCDGQTVYKNVFPIFENAKRALNRNIKK